MATLLTEPPAPIEMLAPAAGAPALRPCPHCASPLAPGQDWCLECGAGLPGRPGAMPGWRTAATAVALVTLLALGTVAAAVAALRTPARHVVTRPLTVAQAPPPAAPAAPVIRTPPPPAIRKAPLPPPPAAATPPPVVTPPPAAKPAVPAPLAPAAAPVVRSRRHAPSAPLPAPKPSSPAPSAGGAPVTLDTNAAITYNPAGYPDGAFGDPALAIDGDEQTSWSVTPPTATAPSATAGLLLDLKESQHLATLALVTDTPGMTVRVYGAVGSGTGGSAAAPPTITDPAWTALGPAKVIRRHNLLHLQTHGQRYRFVVVWITRVPVGSAAAGSGDISEVSLTH